MTAHVARLTDAEVTASLQTWLDAHPPVTYHDRRAVDPGDDPDVWARCSDVDPGGRRADEAAARYERWLEKEQW